MNRLVVCIIIAALSIACDARQFKSGNVKLDRQLININFVAESDPVEYLRKLARRHKVEEQILLDLSDNYEFTAADITAMIGMIQIIGGNFDSAANFFVDYLDRGYRDLLPAGGIQKGSEEEKAFYAFIAKEAPEKDLEAESRNIFLKK